MIAILVALVAGAAWRRWFGSDRPRWMKPVDAWWRDLFGIWRPDRGAPWRGLQVVVGCAALYGLNRWGGDQWWRAPIDTAAVIAFMTSEIKISRRPFEWLMEKIDPPKMWGDFLNGPAPWSEALQGATLWGLAVAL